MPGWLQDTFLSDYAAELTMLLIGLGLLLLIAAALRRRSRGRDESIAETAQRPRIAVLEWAVVDEKRRLVLIQRDEAAHLVMIGGPTDVVIEANIGLPGRATTQVPASQAGYAASRPLTAAASAPVAIEPARAEAAPAPQAALPAAPALEAPLPSAENRQAEAPPAPHAERAPNPSVPAVADPVAAKPAPKPRPPLAAVPAAAAPQGESGRNFPAAAAPDLPGPKRAVAAAGEPHRSAQSGEMRAGGAASRLTPARKEPSLGTGGTSRWAGPGQSAQLTVGEPANTQDRTARDAGNRVQPGPGAPVPANVSGEVGNWTEGDDIEGEIVRALRTDPFPPLAFPAGNSAATRPDPAMPELKIAGTATASPGTTLGDLAEKLEEALAREVRSASHGRTRLDLDLDAFTMHGGVAEPAAAPTATLPPAPTEPGGLGAGGAQHRGPAAANQVAPVRQAHLSAAPTPEARRETQAAIDQQDDPPVISLSARRREIGDPLEDEMARLLGELTDGARR